MTAVEKLGRGACVEVLSVLTKRTHLFGRECLISKRAINRMVKSHLRLSKYKTIRVAIYVIGELEKQKILSLWSVGPKNRIYRTHIL